MEIFKLLGTIAINKGEVIADIKEVEKEAEKSSGTLAQRFERIGQALTDIGKKWSTHVTGPLTLAGGLMLKTAGDFQYGMNQVRALTGATGAEFEALRDQAKELGRTTQFTASQAADAMGFLAMAGFDANQVLGAMPGTLQLAAAAGLDLAESADIVTNILTGYGLEVEQLGRVNDVLVKAFTSSNTNLQQLGEAMKYAGPVASGMGIQFEEAAAILGMMGNAGIQASMAGTSLRGALVRLANPTKQVSDRLRELGVQTHDSNGQLLPMVDILRQLETAGATTSDMMVLFGQRAGPAMSAVLEQGSDSLVQFTAILEDSAGTAAEIAGVKMEGFQGRMLALKSALEGLVLAIADSGLLEWFTELADRATGFVQRLAESDPKLLRLATVIAIVAAAIGPLLIGFGTLITTLGSVAGAISGLTLPMVAVGAGLAVLVALVIQHWDEIKQTIDMAIGFIKDIIGLVMALIRGDWEEAWNRILSIGETIWAFITASIGNMAAAMEAVMTGLSNTLSRIWDSIVAKITEVWNGIKQFFTDYWPALLAIFTGGLSLIVGLLINNWDSITATIHQVWDRITQFLGGTWDMIKGTISAAIEWIKGALSSAWESITSGVSGAWNGIAGTVKGVWDGIQSTIKGGVNGIIGMINRFIGGINKIKIKVPSVDIPLVGKVGGFTIGMPQIPTIPMLAKGGNILDDGLFIVGEEGPELMSNAKGARVSPLGKGAGVTINITGNSFRDRSDLDYLVSELRRVKI